MAEEQGDKNEHISDADAKLDALCDMIRDACSKMDEGSKRLDARMDAVEENFRKMDSERRDARMDAEEEEEKKEAKADRRKDSEEEEEKKEAKADRRKDSEEEEGKPKEVAADRRKDSEEEEKKDRKDSRKDEEMEDRKDAMADSQFMTKSEAAELRAQLAALSARAPAVLSHADRERYASIQEMADPVFQAFNDRAPGPLEGETPLQYKRRLGAKMQQHSPRWKDARLSAVADETILDGILDEVYADSMTAARRGVDVPRGQLRAVTRQSGGHTIIEYEGDTDSWMNQLAGHAMRGTGNWHRPN